MYIKYPDSNTSRCYFVDKDSLSMKLAVDCGRGMTMRIRMFIYSCVAVLISLCFSTVALAGVIADHRAVDDFSSIPANWLASVRSNLTVYNLHQSHGSHIIMGMKMIYSDNNAYYPPELWNQWWTYPGGCEDIGWNGDTCYVDWVRDYLDTNSVNCNVVTVSFSHAASSCDQNEIRKFVASWSHLAQDYPNVDFAMQSARLRKQADNFATTGMTIIRANQYMRDIFDTVSLANLHLFDVGDINWWDRRLNRIDSLSTDSGNTWMPAYIQSGYSRMDCESANLLFGGTWHNSIMGNTDYCAHANGGSAYGCLMCEIMGKAWWYLMARIAGWSPDPPVCGDLNSDGAIDLNDGVYLLNYTFRGGLAPSPMSNADVNNDARVNISDVVYLMRFVYHGGSSLDCPQ